MLYPLMNFLFLWFYLLQHVSGHRNFLNRGNRNISAFTFLTSIKSRTKVEIIHSPQSSDRSDFLSSHVSSSISLRRRRRSSPEKSRNWQDYYSLRELKRAEAMAKLGLTIPLRYDSMELALVQKRVSDAMVDFYVNYNSSFWITITPCTAPILSVLIKQERPETKVRQGDYIIPVRDSSGGSNVLPGEFIAPIKLKPREEFSKAMNTTDRVHFYVSQFTKRQVSLGVELKYGASFLVRFSSRAWPSRSYDGYPRLPTYKSVTVCKINSNRIRIAVRAVVSDEMKVSYCFTINYRHNLPHLCSAQSRLINYPTGMYVPHVFDSLRKQGIQDAIFECSNSTLFETSIPTQRHSANSSYKSDYHSDFIYINAYALDSTTHLSSSYEGWHGAFKSLPSCTIKKSTYVIITNDDAPGLYLTSSTITEIQILPTTFHFLHERMNLTHLRFQQCIFPDVVGKIHLDIYELKHGRKSPNTICQIDVTPPEIETVCPSLLAPDMTRNKSLNNMQAFIAMVRTDIDEPSSFTGNIGKLFFIKGKSYLPAIMSDRSEDKVGPDGVANLFVTAESDHDDFTAKSLADGGMTIQFHTALGVFQDYCIYIITTETLENDTNYRDKVKQNLNLCHMTHKDVMPGVGQVTNFGCSHNEISNTVLHRTVSQRMEESCIYLILVYVTSIRNPSRPLSALYRVAYFNKGTSYDKPGPCRNNI